jgi:dihydrofolate reductase
MIIIVAAAAQNNALGKDNQLIWHLSDDLKRFKSLTLDGYIIMGRKTFESLPGILPRRKHIVITRNPDFYHEGIEVVQTLEQALDIVPTGKDVFVVGGGDIYRQTINRADKIELTRVHHDFEADTFFPEIDLTKWELVNSEFHPKDEKHQYDFTFETYLRRKKTENRE